MVAEYKNLIGRVLEVSGITALALNTSAIIPYYHNNPQGSPIEFYVAMGVSGLVYSVGRILSDSALEARVLNKVKSKK